MKINNTMQVRQQNALLILTELEKNDLSTNTEIATRYSLSIPTVSNIVNILKSNNLIVSSGTAVSSGGRKPSCLSLNSSHSHYVGVSIAKHTIYLTLIDFSGHILNKQRHYITYTGTWDYWKQIRKLISQLQESSGISEAGIGIALPGFVDLETARITDTITLGVSSISTEMLHRIFGEAIYIGDSCRVAGQAQLFGKEDFQDSFFLLLSRRVSGILIREMKLFHLHASSFPVGAMILDPSKKTAEYGAPGSLSDFCSASRIIDTIKEDGPDYVYDDFFAAIRSGNSRYAGLWQDYLEHLAHALHNIYYIFGPNITIGGEMATYIEPWKEEIISRMLRQIPGDSPYPVLSFSIYGEYDEAYGVAIEIRNHRLMDQLPSILLNNSEA